MSDRSIDVKILLNVNFQVTDSSKSTAGRVEHHFDVAALVAKSINLSLKIVLNIKSNLASSAELAGDISTSPFIIAACTSLRF
jgi:hypothetical protein